MWIQVLLVTVLIKLSQAECERNIRFRSRYQEPYGTRTLELHILCTNITPSYNFTKDVSTREYYYYNPVYYITIRDSIIPEINKGMFNGINIDSLNIQATVEIIQSKAFENCSIPSITLDSNDIKEIKDRSFNSSSINVLSLKNNSLSEIEANNFLGLMNLTQLNLGNNQIRVIEERSFNSLKNVEELDLSHNKLVQLHHELFKNMTRLKTLYLNNNLLKNFHKETFSQCESLKYLDISNNYITRIMDDGYLPNSLLHINISNNQLTFAGFSNLIFLETIDMSFNKLTNHGWFHQLPALKSLNISYNSLGPSINMVNFNNLSALQFIDLSGNGLEDFDCASLSKLKQLTELSLSVNNLTHLDFSHCDISLNKLNLSRNLLNEIKNLSRLQNLIELDISFNSLQEIEYDNLESMDKLRKLNLQFNSIHTIHMGSFRNLNRLADMDLSHNKITNIEVGAFTGVNELISLNISHNNLIHLDKNIFHNLRRLTNLDIAYNKLNSVEIDHVLDKVIVYGEVSLTGNNWTCKSLGNLIKAHSGVKLTHGISYNVSNIFGIPCSNNFVVEKDQHSKRKTYEVSYLNSIEEHEKDISHKTSISIFFLVVALTLIILKLSYHKIFHCFTVSKQFLFDRNVSEQEMHLI